VHIDEAAVSSTINWQVCASTPVVSSLDVAAITG